MNPLKSKLKLYVVFATLIMWLALILQFYLSVTVKNDISISGKMIRFFSYFTILTNILVTASFTFALNNTTSKLRSFFTNYTVVSGIALNILIVGILYHILLANIWNPQGWQLLADILLHTVSPVVYLIYWLAYDGKYKLTIKNALAWLIYPLLYLGYALILGKGTGNYPYYFIDVNELGYQQVLLNSLWIMVAFVAMALLFIGANRIILKANSK